MDKLGAVLLADVDTAAPAPMAIGRLDPEGHTVLFGDGGSGKGTLAAWWSIELVRAGHRVLILDYEDHPTEWARRVHGLAGLEPMGDILHVSPLAGRWHGKRGALWDQVEHVLLLAESWGATFIVVDSIVVACGGSDPLDPGTPALYAGALQKLERPVLSLAHVTKAAGLTHPFGSVMWHNFARATWSLEVDGPRRLLVNRKANNYTRGARYTVEITFHDDLPREVLERSYNAVLADRVAEVLATGTLSVTEITDRLNDERAEDEKGVKPDSVRASLKRGLGTRFTVVGLGKTARWAMRDPS